MISSINNLPIFALGSCTESFAAHMWLHFVSELFLCCSVEVKVELSLLEKEKGMDGPSPNGKASPFADSRPNGALGHGSDDDSTPFPPYPKSRDYVEASVCHVKDLENGQ